LAPCLHQGDACARHIPQGTNIGRWHKAGPDEPMGQQLGDPGCIPFIRLFARATAPDSRSTTGPAPRCADVQEKRLDVDGHRV
jgi:hypothetical protein